MVNRQDYERQYQAQRQQHWQGLKDLLESFRHECDATVAELAQGLNISRQKLYDFAANPEKGMAIDRTDILILWEWLTDPLAFEERKISEQGRQKRAALRQEGPDRLLKIAGFLPISVDPPAPVLPSRLPSDVPNAAMRRIVSRLSSPWIEDQHLQSQIMDAIFDQVRDQGRLDASFYTEVLGVKEALGWPQRLPLNSDMAPVLASYQHQICRLARSGKTSFVRAELFELYQSILEYQSSEVAPTAEFDILGCQFRTLSVSLPASVQEEFRPFNGVFLRAEKAVIALLGGVEGCEDGSVDGDLYIPVTRAFVKARWGGDIHRPVALRYSAITTHLENMLAAISSGLVHPLKMTGFSVRATARTAKSLARVSIGLEDRQDAGQIYKGWWVDSNAILALLKAVVIALQTWLQHHNVSVAEYYETCVTLAHLDTRLFQVREAVYEYFFRPASSYWHDEFSSDVDHFDQIEAELRSLQTQLSISGKADHPCYQKICKILEIKRIKTWVTRTRAALKTSNVEAASRRLDDIKHFMDQYEEEEKQRGLLASRFVSAAYLDQAPADASTIDDPYRHILFLHASESVMLYSLFTGDKGFLTEKPWRRWDRYRLDDCLQKLQTYVKAVDTIDFDTFLCVSQIYATIGILELYTAQAFERSILQQAAEHLLFAFHYSNRIGFSRRATYYLIHASRVYARLKDFDKARRLASSAQKMAIAIHQELEEDSDYDSKYKQMIHAAAYLSEGELLLNNGQPEAALEKLLASLTISIEIRFTDRLTADTLYGLYRAAHHLDAPIGNTFALLVIHGKIDDPENPGMTQVMHTIVHHLKALDPKQSWTDAAPCFKDYSKLIWHHWAEAIQGREAFHPIESEIDDDRFLMPIP